MALLAYEDAIALADRIIEPMVEGGRLVQAGRGTLGEEEVERISHDGIVAFNELVEGLSATEYASLLNVLLMERAGDAVRESFMRGFIVDAIMDGRASIHEIDLD